MCGLCGSVNTARFLVHSSDQARGGLETRLCILFAQPVAKTTPFATSSDSYSRSNPW